MTVKENVYLRGAFMGYSKEFIDSKYDEIIDFAEMREFQNSPFRTLSSGMKSRIAFAIASMIEPDIIILDEIFAVGDGDFRKKSQQEQAAASKLRMEKRGEKLERAKDKLAKQKPPKKPGPVRRIGRAAGGAAHGFVHGKIYENEQENVGIEGAHRSELVGESGLRHGKRFVQKKIRQHPAKAVQRAESKYVKATADYHFRMAAQEHPEMSGNPVSRMWRKHRLKKQYQKRAREAAKTGAVSAAKKTAAATEKAGAKIAGFVKRHPVGVLLALACVLLLFMMQSCSSSLVMLGNSGAGAVGATTYPSEDGEILAAEAAYSGMEAELQNYLDTYTATHSYDEYHFDLDEIEHDPYVLILSLIHI